MTLATHAVVGASVAMLFPSHPIEAFIAAFLSHFILDAVPHWDYKIWSSYANPDMAMKSNKSGSAISDKVQPDKYFILDLLHIGFDVWVGLSIIFIVWIPTTLTLIGLLALGAVGGMLPDFLQFVYMRFPKQPMVAIQKFHSFIHADYRLNDRPVIGVVSQIITMTLVVLLVKYLIRF